MTDVKLLSLLLCCGTYRDDEIIKNLCEAFSNDMFRAVGAYMYVCEKLCGSGLTLSRYLFELAAGGEMLCSLLDPDSEKNETEDALYKAVTSDIELISQISALSAETLKEHLLKTFHSLPDRLPSFVRGDTVITPETVIAYKKKYGSVLFAENKAFTFEDKKLVPIKHFDKIRLSDLKNYELQREAVIKNTIALIEGKPHNNVFLYGDRGTGKSSTVKAAANEYEQIRIIYIPKTSVSDIYTLYDIVRGNELKFIFFVDDLTAEKSEASFSILKQALDGSLSAVPDNCAIYLTSNRRHIVSERTVSETADELHAADMRDENLTLYDRFGLFVTFSLPDKKSYLEITEKLALDSGINIPREELFAAAERFAIKKGVRSPRTAKQFIGSLGAESAEKNE